MAFSPPPIEFVFIAAHLAVILASCRMNLRRAIFPKEFFGEVQLTRGTKTKTINEYQLHGDNKAHLRDYFYSSVVIKSSFLLGCFLFAVFVFVTIKGCVPVSYPVADNNSVEAIHHGNDKPSIAIFLGHRETYKKALTASAFVNQKGDIFSVPNSRVIVIQSDSKDTPIMIGLDELPNAVALFAMFLNLICLAIISVVKDVPQKTS